MRLFPCCLTLVVLLASHSLASSSSSASILRIRGGSSLSPTTMSEVPKITYWAGRGRAEPLRCILAAAGVKFENVFLQSKDQMQNLVASGNLAFDQVPLVEIDGMKLVQSGPTAIYLAQKYGFWPEDPKEQYTTGAVFASAADSRACLGPFPFHGDKDKVSAEAEAGNGLWGRYAVKWEGMLERSQSKFVAGDKPTLGDIGVFEVLDYYRHVFGHEKFQEKMAGFRRLSALHDAVLALGALRAWRDDQRPALLLPWDQYAAVVRKTLSP